MKRLSLIVGVAISVLICGCAVQTQNIDMRNDQGKAVMELDYRDFNVAATEMVQSLVRSGKLNKSSGESYVLTTGKIMNDTMQRIDTDQLMAKVEEELLNSGQVTITSAIGGAGATDEMVYDVRELREGEIAEEFDQGTVAEKGRLVAPELSLSGKIFQRNITYDNKTQQVEYYFQLRLTDLKTGLRKWQKETILGKRGSSKTVPW